MSCESYIAITLQQEILSLSQSDWDRISSPKASQLVHHTNLPGTVDSSNLSRLAVLKVNGGLGTTMGT